MTPWGNPGLINQAFSHLRDYRNRATRNIAFEIKPEHRDIVNSLTWHSDAQKLSPREYRVAEILNIHLPRLLKWEDRNSMAWSIESRVPFLDVNLIELILSIEPERNVNSGWNKYLFRRAMADSLPISVCWRKDKKGFETPQDKWMKTGAFHQKLIDWAAKKNHPATEFVATDFNAIRAALDAKTFDMGSMFRLFCLDSWARMI